MVMSLNRRFIKIVIVTQADEGNQKMSIQQIGQ